VRVALGGLVADADIWTATSGGVRTVFVDYPPYFDRDYLYGVADRDYADNAERFAFFAQASLEWAAQSERPYDVVHAHDWQAGLVPLLLQRADPARWPVPPATVFTIHNLAYQGIFDASWLPRLGLGWELMRVEAIEYWGRISYLKAGIGFSALITTVSPRYAQEIQTPELGFGFDGILRARRQDLIGILNGIDYDQWDPASDPNLPEPFDASKLRGKAAAKRKVVETFGLEPTRQGRHCALVAMISRMVDQKGFDLLATLAPTLPDLDASFVLLGTGERRYEDLWRELAARYPDRIGVKIGFDEGLAHLMEGGADIFLMPSRFEPCGLNQMYSLRYGTVPVVRATGGLYDTVEDVVVARRRGARQHTGTGFTFAEHSPAALLAAVSRAIEAFANRPLWRRIQQAGMRQDFSWEASARAYVDVYERASAALRVSERRRVSPSRGDDMTRAASPHSVGDR
jgi:starch synthase